MMTQLITWDQDIAKAQEREGPVTKGQRRGVQPRYFEHHGKLEETQTLVALFLRGAVEFVNELTFSCVEESEGPAATSTIILSPLCGQEAMGNLSVTHSKRDF